MRKTKAEQGLCSIWGCHEPREKSRRFCRKHYRHRGTPEQAATPSGPYAAAHEQVRRLHGKASEHPCAAGCGAQASDWAYGHTDPNPSMYGDRPFSTDPSNYLPLCRTCHVLLDSAMALY